MFALVQIIIDVLLAAGLLVSLLAHIAHRSLRDEMGVLREALEQRMDAMEVKISSKADRK